MYKAPENCNRVKSIKSKFENIEIKNNKAPEIRKNGVKNDSNKIEVQVNNSKQILSRQLSDPVKRNIKRTPAFRIDKTNDKVKPSVKSLQRNSPQNRSYYFENKVKQFNSALKNDCDSNSNLVVIGSKGTEHLVKDKYIGISSTKAINTSFPMKPPLIKSKSSHDFAYIRSKFDKKTNEVDISIDKSNTNQRQIEDTMSAIQIKKDLSSLYTEPIPKLLRNKSVTEKHTENRDKVDIYNAETLKISDSKLQKLVETGKSTMEETTAFTDTLKTALKRPLPIGPAPKKPPRTFEHLPKKDVCNAEKNDSFLHFSGNVEKKSTCKTKNSVKKDPRYMLNKLELALKNNTLRTKNQEKTDICTTSGDDSDDSVLFKSKSSVPATSASNLSNSFKLNCLNGLASCNSSYGKIKEPNSSFFISCKSREEPVYAEPFQHHNWTGTEEDESIRRINKNNRNSLYYMSTSLLCDDEKMCENLDNLNTKNLKLPQNQVDTYIANRKMSSENSSLSSFTSDLSSATSTPVEELKSFESPVKIKQLIDVFEAKQPTIGPLKEKTAENIDGSRRVEDLKMSLQKTIDGCFSNDTKENPSESENIERKVSMDMIINKFQSYVKTMPKYQTPKISSEDHLFICCLIVEWNKSPQIKFKFPNNVEVPHKIEDLCYPEAASGPLDKSNNAQCYSLVITNDKGERTFGYCRRVIPEGSVDCLPLAYCILSKHRAPRFYKKILMELESRHGIPDKQRNELIGKFYRNKFPNPGGSIRIDLTNILELNSINRHNNVSRLNSSNDVDLESSLDLTSFVQVTKAGQYGTLQNVKKKETKKSFEGVIGNDGICSSPSTVVSNGKKTELVLTLHPDIRYEDADLKPLHTLPPNILIKVFASLLLERKVILISCVISKLSSCVDALQSILYPFSWPHTFIPILPQCLWDIVESPTPVICGILSVAVVNQYNIEHGIVIDLDERSILIEVGDENSILSDSMKKAWTQSLTLANTIPPEDYVHSVYLSDAYMKVFVICFKNYKSYIVNEDFQKENFIRNAKTKGIRRFLKWFTETTLFVAFIDLVISNSESFALFDKKMEIYGSEESNLIFNKLLEWKK